MVCKIEHLVKLERNRLTFAGTGDGISPFAPKLIRPHTNLTETSQGLDLLWRNGVEPSKVVLGLAFYGRSFTLADPSCKTPGCAVTRGGIAGQCSATPGILSNAEIQRIIKSKHVQPTLDSAAGVKYMSWDNEQWYGVTQITYFLR